MNCNAGYMNGNLLINAGNKDNYQFTPYSHRQSSYTIEPQLTSAGNINFYGSPNAASVTWCNETFQPKSSSDFRIKMNIRNLDELPDDLYLSLKPKLFEFKCSPYKQNVSNIGLLAQEVISAFDKYGLNTFDYGIVEYANVRPYTDEGQYINDGNILRINYEQLIAWGILINQKLYKQNKEMADRIAVLENKVNSIQESAGK